LCNSKRTQKIMIYLKISIKIVVDGVECKLSRPPVMRGLGTQALLIITAFTTEKPKVSSSEVIKDYE